ncbi:MAG: 3-oxoacyl-ACP reductase FabG [Deltaproteobacteria bacterium]|nr:MAG: 3-oxoacyl-ACP reductase FabG [Deltaproteobacteria bacterium]
MKLKDRVAIVTGGAQGIGKAYALKLAQEGAKVVIADILDAEAVKQEIESKGGEAMALHTDVTDEKSTEEMAQESIEHFRRIDILVNNAAVFASLETKPFFQISAQEWDKVLRVNLKGVFLCCKAVYPQMKNQGKGKIINIASGVFFKGLPLFLHYVASKGGVIALTRALAREVGNDGICVNAIAPGYTLTEVMVDESIHDEAFVNAVVGSRCFKRHERPEDLTGTLVFLASDESDFITGQTIVVDGGATMH